MLRLSLFSFRPKNLSYLSELSASITPAGSNKIDHRCKKRTPVAVPKIHLHQPSSPFCWQHFTSPLTAPSVDLNEIRPCENTSNMNTRLRELARPRLNSEVFLLAIFPTSHWQLRNCTRVFALGWFVFPHTRKLVVFPAAPSVWGEVELAESMRVIRHHVGALLDAVEILFTFANITTGPHQSLGVSGLILAHLFCGHFLHTRGWKKWSEGRGFKKKHHPGNPNAGPSHHGPDLGNGTLPYSLTVPCQNAF